MVIYRVKKELVGATTIKRKALWEDRLILSDVVINVATGGGHGVVGDGSCHGVVVGGGSGDGATVGVGSVDKLVNAPLAVFATRNDHDYDHVGFTDYSPLSLCSICKCQEYKEKHDGVINTLNALTTAVKELTSKRAGLPWHLVDEVYIPVNYDSEFHWVLAVVILKERHIRVYDSISAKRRSESSSELQKMAIMFSTYLHISDFLDQNICTDWSAIEAYHDKMGDSHFLQDNSFDVEYIEGITQQSNGSL
ncbi:hypothetical protein FXO38_12640 [Capsicum annuum]|nr:hypothetical protein FXO38_12640 [Capsicum annuum]KAF3683951.1 hypothetical protein FXO37_01596 [Capsicum annuum]